MIKNIWTSLYVINKRAHPHITLLRYTVIFLFLSHSNKSNIHSHSKNIIFIMNTWQFGIKVQILGRLKEQHSHNNVGLISATISYYKLSWKRLYESYFWRRIFHSPTEKHGPSGSCFSLLSWTLSVSSEMSLLSAVCFWSLSNRHHESLPLQLHAHWLSQRTPW